MTDITLGDRTVSLPDLPRLDLPRPDVSLPDLPIKELSLPELSLPDISLPDLRRRSSASPSTLPMVLLTLAAGLMLGIVLAALAWTLTPVRETGSADSAAGSAALLAKVLEMHRIRIEKRPAQTTGDVEPPEGGVDPLPGPAVVVERENVAPLPPVRG